jgi:hypothetical protein
MKNGFHIKRDFPGVQTRTFGRDKFYTCEAIFPDGETVTGIGSTLESAEDTAWHAVKITLRETLKP